METFLVRTQAAKRLVGMFVARDSAELCSVVEEALDPLTCEYLVLGGRQGIFMDGEFASEILDPSEAPYHFLRPAPGLAAIELSTSASFGCAHDKSLSPSTSESLSNRLDEANPIDWLPLSPVQASAAAPAPRRGARVPKRRP